MIRSAFLQLVLAATLVSSHILFTYPGSRGNSFITNETFPGGMQWTYPCGGLGLSRNRTYWPTTGGSLAFQPGWFSGHATAFLHINIGLDTDGPDGGPMNFTTPLVKPWQLLGPSNGPYPGTLCLPDVKVPENLGIKAGDNATIQIVELAAHGASLFSCSDIIFVEPGDKRIPPINDTVCFNTTEFGFADIYTHVYHEGVTIENPTKSGVDSILHVFTWLGCVSPLLAGLWLLS
ncbi:uncharacterized protein DNG_03548 [Cephalotrichum gorgonifer]|uniref:Copper acquisition factor BIM1-like domain-containing protein n=1 Tax=Cephalotrichum gorgonifer TaxID=2041049 RepID=A0AAE8MUZ0_9PEZI|nr:uncharacterized protein DNG_03548 [Cephalotrichum gorgonifer]